MTSLDGIIHVGTADEPLFEADEFSSRRATIEYARWLAGRDGHSVTDCGARAVREGDRLKAVEFLTPKGELVHRVDLPSWMAAA